MPVSIHLWNSMTVHEAAYIDHAARSNGSDIEQTVARKSLPLPLAERLQGVDMCEYLLVSL
jgi:hypothetical protein